MPKPPPEDKAHATAHPLNCFLPQAKAADSKKGNHIHYTLTDRRDKGVDIAGLSVRIVTRRDIRIRIVV